jgi:uncharacterized protein DUF4157
MSGLMMRRTSSRGATAAAPVTIPPVRSFSPRTPAASASRQADGVGGGRDDRAQVRGFTVRDVVRAPGRPLDRFVREEMEQRFGADFTDVRVHDDGAAHASAVDLGARAYTTGSHIVFQRGRYDAESAAGRELLTHELTHVLQQRHGPVSRRRAGDGPAVSDSNDAFEQAAAKTARQAMTLPLPATAPRPSAPSGGPVAGATVQRMRDDAIADYFTSRNTDLKNKNKRQMIGAPAASPEQLDKIVKAVGGYEELVKFVQTVRAATIPAGNLGAVFAQTTGVDHEGLAAQRLDYLYRIADEQNLDLAGLEREFEAIKKLNAGELVAREKTAKQAARQSAAESAALRGTMDAVAAVGVDRMMALAVYQHGPAGKALIEMVAAVGGEPLNITKNEMEQFVTNIFEADEGQWDGRIKGTLYELTEAHTRLRQGHIIQLGTLATVEALRRIKGLAEVIGENHPSSKAVDYLTGKGANIGALITKQATVGADVVDWTTLTSLQLKATMEAVLSRRITTAIHQAAGFNQEKPIPGPRRRLQARAQIDSSAKDIAALLAKDDVINELHGLDEDTAKQLSVAVVSGTTTHYFVPTPDRKGWKMSHTDPALEPW